MPRRTDRPDIELGAAFRAKKLRFDRVPDTDVQYTGDSNSEEDRKNLPQEVEQGVTYRDVEIRWHAQVSVDDQVAKRRGGKGP